MSDGNPNFGVNPDDDIDTAVCTIVLPVYNERENLSPLLGEITHVLRSIEHEIVAVDDCSSDGSLEVLGELAARFTRLRVVHLPVRRGQSAALVAGFDAARGATIVTLDADGQNDPNDIPMLLDRLIESGPGVAVVGVRSKRAVSGWKRLQARVANAVRDIVTGDRVRDTGCALRVARRADLRKLPRFKGMHRFLPTLLRREGVTVIEIPVNDRPRLHGISKYGMWNRVFTGLVDAWGVRWLKSRALRLKR